MLADELKTFTWMLLDESDLERKVIQENNLDNKIEFMGVSRSKLEKLIAPYIKKWKAEKPQPQIETMIQELFQMQYRELHYTAIELLKVFYKWLLTTMPIDFMVDLLRNYPYWDTVEEVEPLIAYYFKKLDPTRRTIYINRWLADGEMWINRLAVTIFTELPPEELDWNTIQTIIWETKDVDNKYMLNAIGFLLHYVKEHKPLNVEDFLNKVTLDKRIIKSMNSAKRVRKTIK